MNETKNGQWLGFHEGIWQKECNVSDFIKTNYRLYECDESFLSGISAKTVDSIIPPDRG